MVDIILQLVECSIVIAQHSIATKAMFHLEIRFGGVPLDITNPKNRNKYINVYNLDLISESLFNLVYF